MRQTTTTTPTIREIHREAMALAEEADCIERTDPERARQLFARAHGMEQHCADRVASLPDNEPTHSILRRSAAALLTRYTTATHTLIIPRDALLTEPGGRETIWRQEREQAVEAWWHAQEGRFVVVLDGRTFYVAASEVAGVVPVD